MSKLVVSITTYNEVEWFKYSLHEIEDIADKIIITEGGIKGWGNSIRSEDDTLDIIRNSVASKKITLIQKDAYWDSLEEAFNAKVPHLEEGDIVLLLNGDEITKSEHVLKAYQILTADKSLEEIVPVFIHFWRDFWHCMKPKPRIVNITHQRFIRFHEGYHWSCHHPVACNIRHENTVFNWDYQGRRLVLPSWNIFHFSFIAKPEKFIRKINYCQSIGVHGDIFDGNIRFAHQRAEDCFRFTYQEDQNEVLDFDGEHPRSLKNHPMYSVHDKFLEQFKHKNWRDTKEYGNGIVGPIYDFTT